MDEKNALEERREVARKLREVGERFYEVPYIDHRDAVMAIYDAIGTADSNDDSWTAFFWRLADLIDPDGGDCDDD